MPTNKLCNIDPFDLYKEGDLVVSRTTNDDAQFFGVVVGSNRAENKIYVSWYGNVKQHSPDEILMWPWSDISSKIVKRFEEAHKEAELKRVARELVKIARDITGE